MTNKQSEVLIPLEMPPVAEIIEFPKKSGSTTISSATSVSLKSKPLPSSSAPFTFPEGVIDVGLESLSTDSLNSRLDQLITIESYEDIRNEYCAIHLELNRRHEASPDGVRAPRFRARRKPSYRQKDKTYPLADKYLSNDSQIIDMHWLYTHGRSDADDIEAADIFSRDEFDFETASRYVRTHGNTHNKAKWLGLDTDEQWSLATIQLTEIRENWKKLSRKLSSVKRKLHQKARRAHSIRGNEDDWATIFIAAQIERAAIETNKIRASALLPWFQLMTGKSISRQNMSNKIKAVEKHIGEI